MADKNLLRQNNSSIEVYRSSDAAPDNWEDAKFWLINELRRIQNGFFSVDDVIANIGNLDGDVGDTIVQNITNIIEGDTNLITNIAQNPAAQGPVGPAGPEGPQGPTGPQGPAGADGDAGDLIADWKTAIDFTWSSDKITKYVTEAIALSLGNASGSISIGPNPPSNPQTGDLWYENVVTNELYVFDEDVWKAVHEANKDVYVQRNIPQAFNQKPYLWVQTGLGEDGNDFTLWFNDPEY